MNTRGPSTLAVGLLASFDLPVSFDMDLRRVQVPAQVLLLSGMKRERSHLPVMRTDSDHGVTD